MHYMAFRNRKQFLLQTTLLIVTLLMVWFWLLHTPSGLEGKLNAIGYTVCHQISSHSFMIGAIQFPICSRCAGMYLGVFFGVCILLVQKKQLILPTRKQYFFLGFLIAFWLLDGVNSFFSTSLGKNLLYQPSNMLRFITGFGMGICIAITIHFLFNYAIWKKQERRVDLKTSTIALMIGMGLICIALILWQNEILMKIISYISVMTIVLLLTTLYTIIWVLVLHKENSFVKVKDLLLMINIGFLFALSQITLLDAFRLAITGTWAIVI
jgi:uncharacterized membrane protein